MNPSILMGIVLALALPAFGRPVEQERGRPTAILVSPIHDAQVVRGDDGKDHVEYELLVVNAVDQPVTLTSLTVLRSEEHTSELQSHHDLVCRLLLEKKKKQDKKHRKQT